VRQGVRADLIVANNVLAHVPDLNDFVAGMKVLLAAGGAATIEFPHLLTLMRENQYDTIYHEHFSYFSLATAQRVFARHGLAVFDVDELPTHGGSLRVYVAHEGDPRSAVGSANLADVLARERADGLGIIETYTRFEAQVRESKRALLEFLIGVRRQGRTVVGYGAPAKGNTLLNYCGIRTDLIDYTVDRSPHKQGRFLPGTRIPIHAPERIAQTKPDYVLILPWNLRHEIVQQMAHVRAWGGRFVVPIPRVEVLA
jgi:C-methyltransferase C-terminal domain/Methyltransferase domain